MGAQRLWRLLLSDGSHLYTTNEPEVSQLIKFQGAKVEPMDAFVMEKPLRGMAQLHRFDQTIKPGMVRHFYTASSSESREVAKQSNSKLHPTTNYVFRHDLQPTGPLAAQLAPVHCFYDAQSGDHLYTTSEKEAASLRRGR